MMQAIQQVKSIGNPQMMLQQMPQYKQVMDVVNANGGDAKAAFYAKAKEMGYDPYEIIKAMRNA
jgi:hypothetical protein